MKSQYEPKFHIRAKTNNCIPLWRILIFEHGATLRALQKNKVRRCATKHAQRSRLGRKRRNTRCERRKLPKTCEVWLPSSRSHKAHLTSLTYMLKSRYFICLITLPHRNHSAADLWRHRVTVQWRCGALQLFMSPKSFLLAWSLSYLEGRRCEIWQAMVPSFVL